jgi:hypothetical protein
MLNLSWYAVKQALVKKFFMTLSMRIWRRKRCVYTGSRPNAATQTGWTFFVKCQPYTIKDTEDIFAILPTGSKSWLHYQTPNDRRWWMQWKHPRSPHSNIILKWSFCGKESGHHFLWLRGNIANELALYWCYNQQWQVLWNTNKTGAESLSNARDNGHVK